MKTSTIICSVVLSAALGACSESSGTPSTGNTAGTNGNSAGSNAGSAGSSTGASGGGGSGQGGQAGSVSTAGNNAIPDAATAGAGGNAGAPSEAGVRDAAKSVMTFFVTSTGSGALGGNLGGLTGADKKCQDLATAVGGGDHTWHAYLSVSAAAPGGAVNAREHVGPGPWVNQKGTLIAGNVMDLHTPAANMTSAANSIDEKGDPVPTGGATGNQHDILTGSNPDGTLFTGDTCNDWTSATTGTAYVGHCNRMGTNQPPNSVSWNSSHAVSSCSEAGLKGTGGAGRIYCFAID